MEWNMEWRVNVHSTAKSSNWRAAQSSLSYTYYGLGSTLQKLYEQVVADIFLLLYYYA